MSNESGSVEPWPSAAILLTGLSASGKTTLGRALVSRLQDLGIECVELMDGEEFRAQLPRPYGYSPADRAAVWQELVSRAREKLSAGKVVVIAAIAHEAAWRTMAREQLQPFFEVRLDCPAKVCAARDFKGQYQRAFNNEYDCFIGVTHPYEEGSPDLRIDTAALAAADAQDVLAERVVQFLATADGINGLPAGYWLAKLPLNVLVDKVPASLWETPWLRNRMLRAAQKRRPYTRMERRACAQLFVMFGGADVRSGSKDGDFSHNQLELLKAGGLIRRNLLYVRDPYLDNFSHGISEEIASPASLAAWIDEQAESMPHVSEMHALGYSSGSYGALMFAHLCRMQTAWAFSPRTIRPTGSDEAMARLKAMLSAHNGVTEYHILYSAQNRRDREFASVVEGCPGVSVHPYQEGGNDHLLFGYLAFTGQLKNILPPYRAALSNADTRTGYRPQDAAASA